MKLVPAFTVAALFAIAVAQDSSTDIVSDNFIGTKPSVRLDPYIRKALLKALSELEDNNSVTTDTDDLPDDPTDGSTSESELLTTSDVTENSAAENPERIQIHSFVVNGQSAFANSTNVTPTFIDNNFSILSTTAGNVENQVTATLPTQAPQNEIIQTRESGLSLQHVRSVQDSSTSDNIISSTINSKPTTTTTTSTTTTTTTTTTPKPTHNQDGENIEDVDKRDVQVFKAPLVAAFTVHQDAQGLPKKVVPHFQQPTNANNVTPQASAPLATGIAAPVQQPVLQLNSNQIDPNFFINQQLTLQKQLEEKQRILEEQLRQLQIQQRQQEEALRKQQFLYKQKQQLQEAQRQQQILFEQQRIQALPPAINFQGLPRNNPPNQFLNQNNGLRPQSSQVSIQQSVPLEQANNINIQQQLPNREAVDFLIQLRSHQPEQFPLQENHLPHGITNFLQPNFQQNQNFNQIRQDDPFRQKGNRVFRQESGVGNFGFNNFQQQQQQFQQQQQQFQQQQQQQFNRFNSFNFAPNNRFVPIRQNQFNPADIELKQLLVQTGLNARSPEDLNIVTKVLSLNHGVPVNNVVNNVSNRLPFDSRRQVRA